MSFPRYPKYQTSGVEWLGDVPESWEVRPLKQIAEFVNGAAFKPTEWVDAGTPIIRIQNLNGGEEFNYFSGEVDPRYWVNDGDLLFGWSGNRGTSFGPFLWSHPERCYLNQHIFRVVPKLADKRELFWVLKAVTAHVEDQAHGIIGMVHVTKGDLGSVKIPVPPPLEQTAIAAFLDRETGKIDELVAEQRRLMELLKEKRQAVISHAVTQGLNPQAPMKPSGIEWLGDVPEHWEVKKVKFVTASVKAGPFGSALTKDVYVSSGFRVYGQEQVIPNDFTIGDYFITPEKYKELSQYSVLPGDILISCVGTFGKIAIVPCGIEPGIINPRLIRLRCSQVIRAAYLVEVMRSNVTFEQLSSFTRGGKMDVINIGTLSEIFLALPPMAEQQELLAFIQREIAKFDLLTAEAQRAIDLLQERRTALISAAVTGQIDVRGDSGSSKKQFH